MLKKIIVVTILLMVFQGTVYGAAPSALELLRLIYPLQPGENVIVAYDLLGTPQETVGKIGFIPPAVLWNLESNRTMIIYLHDDSIIKYTSYMEIYEQMKYAIQRYKELKEGFKKVLGVPFDDSEGEIMWAVGNFVLGLSYPRDGFGKQNSKVIISFLRQL